MLFAAWSGYYIGSVFAVSVVGCLLGSSSCLVVWIPLFLDPSDGAFGRFDFAALCGCRTLNFCFVFFCFRAFLVKGSSIEAGWLEVGDYSVLWFRTAKKLAKHSM